MLLLLLGMLEFGRALNYWLDETHLANLTARYAAVNRNPGSGPTLQQSILAQATTSELRDGGSTSVPDGATLCISFPNGTSNVGDPVKATVSVNFNWIPFLGVNPTEGTLTGSATMRLEATPTEYSAGCYGGESS